jgi:hypothetical protein
MRKKLENFKKTAKLAQFFPALFLAALFAAHAFCANYWLDCTIGDDNSRGTKDLPFKTLEKAVNIAKPGDIITINAGKYGRFTARPTAKFPGRDDKLDPNDPRWLTFKAAEGNVPEFSDIEIINETGPALLAYKFYGIKVAGSVKLQGIVGFEMQNCEVTGVGESIEKASGGTVSLRLCGSVNFQNCKIHFARKTCVSISSSSHVTFDRCEIYDVGDDHFTLRTEFADCNNIDIINNNIHTSLRWNPESHGDAIQFYSAEGHKFYNCRVTGNIIRDMAVQGLFTSGNGFVNGLIENNLIYNVKTSAINLANTENTIFRNNTVAGFAAFSSSNPGLQIYNNLFAGPYKLKDPAALGYHNYNIYVRDWKDWVGRSEPNSFPFPNKYTARMTNQLFVNSKENDFHLKPGCRAIDFCPAEPPAPKFDIAGNPRDSKPDAGCYEFTAPK